MAKVVCEDAPEFEVLPPDTVITVRVLETSVNEYPGKNGSWEKLEFKFEIERVFDESFTEAVGQWIWGGCAFRLTNHPDNTLNQWTAALLGIEPGIGFELDTDMFVGKKAKAVVSNYNTKDGKPRHKVEALLPLETASVGAPMAAPAAVAPPAATDEVPF